MEHIIELLRLTKCASTKVGSPWQRGISGGERKRTSIGVELLTNPLVLFMDEPTSGPDPRRASDGAAWDGYRAGG